MSQNGKPGSTPELAAKSGLHRTIPLARATIDVSTSEGNSELAAYAGKFVFLFSRVGTTTIQRATSSPTLTAGVGFVIAEGSYEEFYIDPNGEMTLYHIGDNASGKLEILYDTEHR